MDPRDFPSMFLTFAAEVAGPYTLASIATIAAVLLYALRYSTRRLEVKLGSLHATVDHVNRAVNNRPAGDPTIYEHVKGARESTEAVAAKLDQFIDYQHGRNHDILNDVTAAKGLAKLALEAVATLEAKGT